LAGQIAGAGADPECFELACRIAAAQIDLVRARCARLALFANALCERDGIARLAAIERYEQRAWSPAMNTFLTKPCMKRVAPSANLSTLCVRCTNCPARSL
jgi:hypothetical protein